jgi:hypothetical protein
MWIWAYWPYCIQESPWDRVRSIASCCLNVKCVQWSLSWKLSIQQYTSCNNWSYWRLKKSIWIYYSSSVRKLFVIWRLAMNWKKSQFLRCWTSTLGKAQTDAERERVVLFKAFFKAWSSSFQRPFPFYSSTQ